MKIKRRKTRQVKVGTVKIGGGAPVSIQSMTKTRTADTGATLRQIRRLEQTGCEIVRLALRTRQDTLSFSEIRRRVRLPLVADIHFNYKLALAAIVAGADAVRLNPGNIYRKREVEEVIRGAKAHKVPLRIGLNSGSLPPGKGTLPEKMVRACRSYLKLFEKREFFDIIISLKTSDVASCIYANRMMAKLCEYPFHLGVTAAGAGRGAVLKSALGIGTLLLEGIGDTVRVSLTGSPYQEVRVGRDILQSLGIRSFHPEIIACPTCGRCEIDLPRIVREVERKLLKSTVHSPQFTVGIKEYRRPLKVAIMGCVVNGPGEAREADIGIAGGKNCGLLFRKGKVIRKIKEEKLVDALIAEIQGFSG